MEGSRDRAVVLRRRWQEVPDMQHIMGGQLVDDKGEQNGATDNDGGVNRRDWRERDGTEARTVMVDQPLVHSCERK